MIMTVATRLNQARSLTDSLWGHLRPGTLLERPIPDRHRLIFYLGHLEAFDWNLIARRGLNTPSFHSTFDRIFEFGIDPAADALPQDSPQDWPTEAEILTYNHRTRAVIDRLLPETPAEIVEASIEHRLMHAETLAYLLHNLPYTAKIPHAYSTPAPNHLVPNPVIDVPAGIATLGKEADSIFGWDNEYSRHSVDVRAFRAGQYKVTNGEYLNFVTEGGPVPHFWLREQGTWFYRGMFELVPLPLAAPVYVTHTQATAYAAWAGKALLSEPQFHRLADTFTAPPANSNFQHWDPTAVDLPGVSTLIGNGWEWTRTPFTPFAGFKPHAFYPGYSADFFDGQHYVMKGASPRTAACFLRPSFRNWFRPDYPYVYATFRVVEEAA
jgi:formylglycine-generating enzyme required for sulfatase activity